MLTCDALMTIINESLTCNALMTTINESFQEYFDTTFMGNRKNYQNICAFFFFFLFPQKFSQSHKLPYQGPIIQQKHKHKATLCLSFNFQPKLNISIIFVQMSLKTILNIMFQKHCPLMSFYGTINILFSKRVMQLRTMKACSSTTSISCFFWGLKILIPSIINLLKKKKPKSNFLFLFFLIVSHN